MDEAKVRELVRALLEDEEFRLALAEALATVLKGRSEPLTRDELHQLMKKKELLDKVKVRELVRALLEFRHALGEAVARVLKGRGEALTRDELDQLMKEKDLQIALFEALPRALALLRADNGKNAAGAERTRGRTRFLA